MNEKSRQTKEKMETFLERFFPFLWPSFSAFKVLFRSAPLERQGHLNFAADKLYCLIFDADDAVHLLSDP